MICSMSSPCLCKLLAKVLLNVCGLHRKPILFSSLYSMIWMPLLFMFHILKRSLLAVLKYSFMRFSVLDVKGAFRYLAPLPQIMIFWVSKSICSSLMLMSSLRRMPESASRLMIALSRVLSA